MGVLYYSIDVPTPKKEPTKVGDLKDVREKICDISGNWKEFL